MAVTEEHCLVGSDTVVRLKFTYFCKIALPTS